MKSIAQITTEIKAWNPRSAWDKGVKKYALEVIAHMKDGYGLTGSHVFASSAALEKDLLSGAPDWREYAGSGFSLVYTDDIMKRLCTPSEYKTYRKSREWPGTNRDVLLMQALALYQAAGVIKSVYAGRGINR